MSAKTDARLKRIFRGFWGNDRATQRRQIREAMEVMDPNEKVWHRDKAAATARKLTTEADGRALAVAMLRSFGERDDDDSQLPQWELQAMYRSEGTQQDNVLLRHLMTMRDEGTAEALAGFCAVLTAYIGACENGGVPDASCFENLTERDVTGKPGPWPTTNDPADEPVRDPPPSAALH